MESAYPAYAMSAMCIAGGLVGFLKTRSIPSIVAGSSIGLLYLYSAYRIQTHGVYGLELALVASVLLLLSSLPRVTKGPVPVGLAASSAVCGLYYLSSVYNLMR